ncbi:MAG: hypothetical protein HQ510_03945 [Candidatus Marinimicrobia bacterium]|nr:hypothetical protein [Candidatus Neomarinimicrobiota bacterium]
MANQKRGYGHGHGHSLSYAHLRKHMLGLSLSHLRDLVQLPSPDNEGFSEEFDIDMEFIDSDEISDVEEHNQDGVFLEDVVIDNQPQNSPFLELDDNLIILVSQNGQNVWECSYEPPRWMTSRVSSDYKHVLNDMVKIVGSIAKYFQNTQQAFLADPSPENLKFEKPLTQKYLVELVRTEKAKFDDGDLSLIKDKIWFLWDDKCFRLESIFNNKE